MAKPLTFGVEFEFALAYVEDPFAPKPYPQETRRVQFPGWTRPGPGFDLTDERSIKKDIVRTLSQAGFPAELETFKNACLQVEPPASWVVKGDPTIRAPKKSAYEYAQIEVVSPAYYFTASAVKAVESVVGVLVSTYCLHLNSSTGLHCHVGCGTDGFALPHLKHLIALLWLVEPQIASIHPPERFKYALWCQPMRGHSVFAKRFQRELQRIPGPLEGVFHFMGVDSMEALLRDASCNGRYGAFNFSNLHAGNKRQTIEFRGHKGCLDPAEVRVWILTLVGMVGWVRDASAVQMEALFLLTREEKWEKLGDLKDNQREEELGPILAEGRFTVIDLLKYMRLYEPALYYATRTYKHKAKRLVSEPWF